MRLQKKLAFLSICLLLASKARAADRTLTGDRLQALAGLQYIGGDFRCRPPKARSLGDATLGKAITITRSESVIDLRRKLAIGGPVRDVCQYTLSEGQVRTLSNWKGSNAQSSSSQLATIILGQAKPSLAWNQVGTFTLVLAATYFVGYKIYNKFFSADSSTIKQSTCSQVASG